MPKLSIHFTQPVDGDDDHRIGNDKADREGDEPSADVRTPRRRGRRYPSYRALLKPWREHKRIEKPAGADHGDNDEQHRPARGQDQLVAEIGDRLKADQRQEQAEGEQRREAGIAQRAGPIDALCWRAILHLRPFPHPAGRTGPAAGRSA
jgi:hypothetical protein